MPSALKGRMPRVLPDHRSHEGKRLREVYLEFMGKLSDAPGPARRIGVMTAEAWIQYEDLGVQIARAKKNKRSALEIRRLKKERRLAAGHYLGGLRELSALEGKSPVVSPLDKLLAEAVQDDQPKEGPTA